MGISQRRYVDITSGVIGATAVSLQKLVGRVFTDSKRVPAKDVISFYTAGEVLEFFGPGDEASFASAYFSYVSPAPVSRAKEIQFAVCRSEQRDFNLRGATAHLTLDEINGLSDFDISVVVDGATTTASADGVATASSYDEVATEITSALNTAGATGVTVTYDRGIYTAKPTFVITYSGTGSVEVDSGDLASALGLDVAVVDEGGDAQTMLEAYAESIDVSDSFGSALFLTTGDIDEVVDVAEFNAAQNVKHQLYVKVTPQNFSTMQAALIGTASVGLILETPNNKVTAHLPMASMAATDYDRTNATVNYMYRQSGVTLAPQVTTSQDADKYDKARVNYYGETAVAGSNIQFFQRAFLCGPVTAPLDMSVHANEQWFKAYIAQQWFTLQLSTRGIPANLDGIGRAKIVIADAITKALNNGTILVGKTLTTAQKLAVTDATGDYLAWHDIQDRGYWYDAEVVENTGPSGLPEHVLKYTVVYAKGDWVRKIEGSHNLV